MTDRPRYRNSPIQEALCEFRFVPETEWDDTIPAKLQSLLGDEYSTDSRQQRAVQVNLNVDPERAASLSFEEGLARVLLQDLGGNRVVGVGPNVVSIHMLQPYQNAEDSSRGGWEEFGP